MTEENAYTHNNNNFNDCVEKSSLLSLP